MAFPSTASKSILGEEFKMKDTLLMLSIRLRALLNKEEGQDLIEYALVAALIAFGAVTAMRLLSNDINNAYSYIDSKF